ncbi:MAG TPA: hypothetical protein VH877_01695 [Polyangia bacterium]|jgi:hypothetical protein|nr:hypothetical protein [Polyangia bacterium]
MHAGLVEEEELFRAVQRSGTRALLIGRRALIMLGLPVATFDYDFWIHIDDAERLNQALEPLGLVPNRSPEEARRFGRYVLENDTRVDVMVARVVPTVDGQRVAWEDVWERRVSLEAVPGIPVAIPCVDDLIATKRFGARAKDANDIQLLQVLQKRGTS